MEGDPALGVPGLDALGIYGSVGCALAGPWAGLAKLAGLAGLAELAGLAKLEIP